MIIKATRSWAKAELLLEMTRSEGVGEMYAALVEDFVKWHLDLVEQTLKVEGALHDLVKAVERLEASSEGRNTDPDDGNR